MTHRSNDARRVLALVLAALLAALSVAVPLLDREAGHELPAFESAGAGSACILGHDHGICTQHGANPQAPTAAASPEHAARVAQAPPFGGDGVAGRSLHIFHPNSRAPPIVL